MRAAVPARTPGFSADAVDLGIEAGVARAHEQVLSGHIEPCRCYGYERGLGELISDGDALQPDERGVLHHRAVEPPRPRVVGARNRGLRVRGRPPVEDAVTLVEVAGRELGPGAADVGDLVALREVDEGVEGPRAGVEAVRQSAVELRLRCAKDDAIGLVYLAVTVGVENVVFAWHAVHTGSRHRERTRIARLEDGVHLESVKGAERLADLHDVTAHVGDEEAIPARARGSESASNPVFDAFLIGREGWGW